MTVGMPLTLLSGTHSSMERDGRSHVELRHDELPVQAPPVKAEEPPKPEPKPELEAKAAPHRNRFFKPLDARKQEKKHDAKPEDDD